MTIVELQSVEKTYWLEKVEVKALRNVNLKIEKSERLAIIGPSGSGKSTMLHLIGCLDRPTKGKIFIDGTDTSKLNNGELAKLRREKIGFVFQFFHLLPTLTALENVELPMTFAGISKTKKEERARKLLELVGLKERMHHKPAELSGGERQRVAIARALANNPQLILADEPTGNLDSSSGGEIIKLLEELNEKEKVTLIIITHDPMIAANAERIIYLKDGEIVREETR